ncbi:MAG: hypothetical protein QNL61_05800 [Crocinitomicaceae bacterium]
MHIFFYFFEQINFTIRRVKIDQSELSYRAIIDIGLLDMEEAHIKLKDTDLEIVGASSDMLVIDLGVNKQNYKVGDLIEFGLDYMGILRAMNSNYIEKRIL